MGIEIGLGRTPGRVVSILFVHSRCFWPPCLKYRFNSLNPSAMKLTQFFLLGLCALAICACGSSSVVPKSPKEDISHTSVENPDQNISLSDHLRKLSGVSVSGSGPNARITIRGVNSLNAGTEPLFVINGQAINGGLRAASDIVSVNDIQSIRVLKNPSETGFYGVRGANGVIEIKLKN